MSAERGEGLEGVVAAKTRLSMVDGERGELWIAGYRLDDLAPNATYEEALHVLWYGRLPKPAELVVLRRALGEARVAAAHVVGLVNGREQTPMDALRAGIGALVSTGDDARDALATVGATATLVAAIGRGLAGKDVLGADPALGHAEDLLRMLDGEVPSARRARALDTYMCTVIDHGLNASTFAARVVTSTGSDLVSAVTAAIGALKGPLHGGAPGPALELVREIGTADRADAVIRERLARGERLMGFGHRVYKVRDPRADVLGAAAEELFDGADPRGLFALARSVEATALGILREHKPDRPIHTNVEYYTALLLDGIGLPDALFTPVFAAGRAGGWTAHALEQRARGRLIRPQSEYVGPEPVPFQRLE